MEQGVHTTRQTAPRAAQALPVTPERWERAMRSAQAAERMGQIPMALAYQQQALALSLRLLQQPPPGREDDCMAALVVSHQNVAELLAQAAALNESARMLCRAHHLLLGLMADAEAGTALQQAAWRHSRQTHAALLAYVQAHGAHPAIARALAAATALHMPRKH